MLRCRKSIGRFAIGSPRTFRTQVQALQAKGAKLIETRAAAEFGEAKIKGAVLLPYTPENGVKAVPFDPKDDKFEFAFVAIAWRTSRR